MPRCGVEQRREGDAEARPQCAHALGDGLLLGTQRADVDLARLFEARPKRVSSRPAWGSLV